MELSEKVATRQATIGVIGLGYVGLPVAVCLAEAGYRIVGIDTDLDKVKMIRAGRSTVGDIEDDRVRPHTERGQLTVVHSYEQISECDAVCICVPTPFTRTKEPDISCIIDAAHAIAEHLRPPSLIILRSTTFPETTEKVVQPIIENAGYTLGTDFFLAFSPERIDPGNKKYNLLNTPTVVGGATRACTKLTADLLRNAFGEIVEVSSPRVAEMAKLLENIFRSVNIALVNELACLCERMGNIDIWEVIEAASTKPFGFMPFYPGPGIGGHCILVDPYYLSWKAREYDFHIDFIELAAETNEGMPYFVAQKVINSLSRIGKCASQSHVLVLGVAFKRDVADTRNSPALKVMEILGAQVERITYNDPFVPSIRVGDEAFSSIELTVEAIRGADCVLITTDHTAYDYDWICKEAQLIVDTRNAVLHSDSCRAVVVKLGRGEESRRSIESR